MWLGLDMKNHLVWFRKSSFMYSPGCHDKREKCPDFLLKITRCLSLSDIKMLHQTMISGLEAGLPSRLICLNILFDGDSNQTMGFKCFCFRCGSIHYRADYRAVSFCKLWASWTHSHNLTMSLIFLAWLLYKLKCHFTISYCLLTAESWIFCGRHPTTMGGHGILTYAAKS